MEDEDKANLQKKVAELEENISQLNGSNNNLVQTIQEQDQYIAKLEKKNSVLENEIQTLQVLNKQVNVVELAKKFDPVLTENQINLILKKKLRVTWTKEEIARAFTLRYFSKKAYCFMRNEGYPLPNLKTLQYYARKINLRNGILHDILNLMNVMGKDLSETEKATVIMYDEMKVKALYEYDVKFDEIKGPHNYVQVVIARGLYSNWKQVIFVDFDTNMTTTLVHNIVRSLHEINYNVVAFVSDCGGANQGVIRDLGINMDKVYFDHPITGKKICYFPDAPHILKLIRNWLLDTGKLTM